MPSLDGPTRRQLPGESLIHGAVNFLSKTVDLNNATWLSDATHEVFTVTGVVRVRLLIHCTEDVTSGGAATLSVGPETDADGWIADTGFDLLNAGLLWFDATPAAYANTSSAIIDKIVYGEDIGYEVDAAAVTDGTLVFSLWWEPISSDGAVALGAGGVLA